MPRILITRAPHQASPLADALTTAGYTPILIPTIEITDPTSFTPLDTAIAALLGIEKDLAPSGPDPISSNPAKDQAPQGSNPVFSIPAKDQAPQGSNPVLSIPAKDQAPQGSNPVLSIPATNQVPQGFSLGSHSQPEKKGALAPAFHWLLFTSANAVEAFAKRLNLKGTGFSPSMRARENRASAPEGATLPSPCRIAAIGPSTARAIEQLLSTKPHLIPPTATAESLAKALLPHTLQPDGTPTRFLLLRAEVAPNILPEALRKAGADVTVAPAYRTVIPTESQQKIRDLFHTPANHPDAILFTSSSTATNLLALSEAASLTLPPDIPRISIGPITSQTLRDAGLPPHSEATEPTIQALVERTHQLFLER